MLANLSIKSRLIFVIGFLSVLLVGSGIIGLASLSSTNQALKTVYEDRVIGLGQLEKISALINKNQILIAESVSSQLSAFPEEVSAVDQRVVELKSGIDEIDIIWKAYLSTRQTAEEAALAKEFDTNRRKYGGQGLLPAIAALSAHDFQQAGEVLQGAMRETYPAVRGSVEALIRLQLDVAKGAFEASQDRYVTVRTISIVIMLAGVLLAALIGFWLIRAITRPLNEAVRIAESVAAGDLSQRIDVRSQDETGQLMQAMQDMNASLVNIVSQVRTGTETIAVASREIASGNADLSNRTESQASSLEETASSMEELTSTVKQNAENARQANQLVVSTSDVAVKGGQVVGSGGRHHGLDQGQLTQDRRHHRRHRRHCLPDQHSGAERGGRSRARRRTGPRLCRGRLRSAQPGAAQRRCGQGDQGPDRGLGRQGGSRRQAGGRSRQDHGRDRDLGQARDRHHERDCSGQPGTERRHRAGQPGDHARWTT